MCYRPAVHRDPGPSDRLRRALRRPSGVLRGARSKVLGTALRTPEHLPLGLRRAIAAPIDALTGQALARRPDHPVAAPLRLVSLHVTDRHDEMPTFVESLGQPPGSVTAYRVARIAFWTGEVTIADDLLATVPPRYDRINPSVAALRGKVDFKLGRYAAAMDHLELAAEGDPERAAAWRQQADRARRERRLLDPRWRATLGPPRPVPPDERHLGRILHLLTNSLPYRLAGYTVRAQQVARAQRAVGLDPVMVTRAGFPGNANDFGDPDADGDASRIPPRDVIDDIPYERIQPEVESSLPVDDMAEQTAAGLRALVDAYRPALLQPTTNYINGQIALSVGEHSGIPVVYEVRGFLEETWRSVMGESITDSERYQRTKAIETEIMRRAAGVVTLSETMRADILARGGVDPDKVVVIPNAVDVDRFHPGSRDETLASSLGIEPDEAVVGYISSLTSYEGITYLLEAVSQLRADGRRVRALVVGDGKEREALEAIVAADPLLADGGAILTGRVPHDDIEGYYRLIDVFVVPRTNDRVSRLVTPLKPYEAMAMARPIVVSAVPALQEIVRDGETGRTFAVEDAGDLAAVVAELLDDPAERERLGTAARAWVSEHRTWAQNGQRYLELYRRLGVA